jgi:aminoglycoside phosphotransferase (APT) family kinase protein
VISASHSSICPIELASYLEAHVEGFRGPLQLTKFDQGQSNPTFLMSSDSGRYVLRRKPPGELLASAHAVDREYKVLRALAETDVPVPQAIHLCEDESIIGSIIYLMSFEDGRIFWDPALPEVARDQRRPILEAQVRVLAAMHNVDIHTVGLSDYGPSENYYERQLSRWSKQYQAAKTEHIASMETLMQWLPANIPADASATSLIHGDYRLDNMIYHPKESRVLAVLDWELSTLGHPLADLAYLCMCMRLPEVGPLKGLAGKDRSALGVPTEEHLVALYCQLRDIDSIEHWQFYLAFSYFRIASICQGVFKRAQDGNASDSKAASRSNVAPGLADMAIQLLQEGDEL